MKGNLPLSLEKRKVIVNSFQIIPTRGIVHKMRFYAFLSLIYRNGNLPKEYPPQGLTE